jgi:predicted nucleic acid-binding protein
MVEPPRDEAVRHFPIEAITDTCSVWNILCSRVLTSAAKSKGHQFILTDYIHYECLVKKRKRPSDLDQDLQKRLRSELTTSQNFSVQTLGVDDLLFLAAYPGVLKQLDRGELSALALAQKLRKGFLTDERAARKAAESVLGLAQVRTVPHLVGWLVYGGHLTDSDIPQIIADNTAARNDKGRIGKFIQKCFEHALGMRLRDQIVAQPSS